MIIHYYSLTAVAILLTSALKYYMEPKLLRWNRKGPVCGTNNKSYGSIYVFNAAKRRNPYLKILYPGICQLATGFNNNNDSTSENSPPAEYENIIADSEVNPENSNDSESQESIDNNNNKADSNNVPKWWQKRRYRKWKRRRKLKGFITYDKRLHVFT